jgi:hypothetical protein
MAGLGYGGWGLKGHYMLRASWAGGRRETFKVDAPIEHERRQTVKTAMKDSELTALMGRDWGEG